MMLTIKTIAVAVALVAGTAAVTYTATTTLLVSEVAPADTTCEALLAEMRASKEEEKAKKEAYRKWSAGTPLPPMFSGPKF